MDSILLAHVADAITAVTGNDDFDAVADLAADLLQDPVVYRIAQGVCAGRLSDGELRTAVRAGVGL